MVPIMSVPYANTTLAYILGRGALRLMSSFSCNLWAILLGAALGPIAYAAFFLLNRTAAESEDVIKEDAQKQLASGPILYLTPRCVMALGRCGRPSALRRMTPEAIGRRLTRFRFPPQEALPSAAQYATWPDQARLLCAGKLDDLKGLREKLTKELGPPNQVLSPVPAREDDREVVAVRRPGGFFWLALALGALLLLAALLAGWIAGHSSACACKPTVIDRSVTITPTVTTASLSTDLVFDFKMSQPRPGAHTDKLVSDLRQLFQSFGGIRITGVSAHTDPIGGTTDNQVLAKARATAIGGLIVGIIAQPDRPGQFVSDKVPIEQADGPGQVPADARFWDFCFTKYYLNVHEAQQQPLVDLRPSKNTDHRVPCSQVSKAGGYPYPACAVPDVPGPGHRPQRGYAQRAENLRELTTCLAPMRHVLINFSYDRIVVAPASKNVTPNKGATP